MGQFVVGAAVLLVGVIAGVFLGIGIASNANDQPEENS